MAVYKVKRLKEDNTLEELQFPFDIIEGRDYDKLDNIPIINKDLTDYKNSLPDAYTELTSLITSGNQQIDLGVNCTEKTNFELTIDIAITKFETSKIALISDEDNLLVTLDSNSHLWITYNGGTETDIGKIDDKSVIKKVNNIFSVNDINVYEGSTAEFTGTKNLKLLSDNNHTCVEGIQIINCSIYEDNVVERLLLPAIKISDSTLGLFDMKTKELFENSGSGSFTAGRKIIGTSITGYTEVQYIACESNSVFGWFDTGYLPNGNTKVVTKFRRTNAIDTTNLPTIYGAQSGSGTTTKRFAYMASSVSGGVAVGRADYNTTMKYNDGLKVSPNKDYIVVQDKNTISLNNDLTLNVESSVATFNLTNSLAIFNLNNYLQAKSQFVGRIYYLQIFENDVLVKNLVPMKRITDSIVGFYDTLSDTFIEQTGTALFKAGDDQKSQLATHSIPGIIEGRVYRHTGISNYFIENHLYSYINYNWIDLCFGFESDKAQIEDSFYYIKGTESSTAVTTVPYQRAIWRGTNSKITTLYDGMHIAYRVQVAGNGTYGTVLNINELGDHPVVYNINSMISTRYGINSTVLLTYNSSQTATAYIDGVSTTIQGVWQAMDYDSNDVNYQLRDNYLRRYTGNAIYRYQICVSDGNKIIAVNTTNNSTSTSKSGFTTLEFDPFGNIYWYNSTTTFTTVNTLVASSAFYYKHPTADLRYSFNSISSTAASSMIKAGDSIYLVCSPQTNGKVKLYYGESGTDYKQCLSTSLPTTEDNLVYIYLGQAYDSYRVELCVVKNVYWYKNGCITEYKPEIKSLAYKDSLTAADVGALPDTTVIPTKVTDLTDASNYVKTDDSRLSDARPASDVKDWAKADTKPTYTADEVGALTEATADNKYQVKGDYQHTLTAGENIKIENNVISSTAAGGGKWVEFGTEGQTQSSTDLSVGGLFFKLV